MTDATEGLRLALESSEADIARLRVDHAAMHDRMVRAEKSERSARACLAALLPTETLDALAKGKVIDDGGESVEDVLRARIAELNDALDMAAGDNAALRAQNAYLAPRQRAGQLVANAMYALDPAFYEAHRGTAIDPFNHDESVVEYLRAWRESERAIARKYLAASDAWDVLISELEAFKARHVEAWWQADGYAALSDRITATGRAKLTAKRALTARIGSEP